MLNYFFEKLVFLFNNLVGITFQTIFNKILISL